MNKKKLILLCLSCSILLIVFYFYQKEDNIKFVKWGDNVDTVNIEILKKNNIEYKIEGNKVYIPKKSFDKAIYCCS
ncbi:hypothetical protein [Bacillus cereus]|uniref:hypothetical protein n=1 Tax=Bacillus cereus TaxID=1396 RepID=UPI001F5B1771